MAFAHSMDAREMFDKKLMQKYHSPDKWKFKAATIQALGLIDVYTPTGIYLGKQNALPIDSTRVLRIITKITKGIFYLTHKEPLPENWPVRPSLLERGAIADRRKIEASGQFKSVCNGVFKYFYRSASDDKRQGMFWFTFYDCVDFVVFTNVKELPIQARTRTAGFYF
jgi:hypothetical protein